MEPFSRWETVRTYECGPDCLLKPDVLLHWIQDVAEAHASHLGFGSSFCMENGLGWVEIRLSGKIHRLPKWRETLNASTWTFPSSPVIAWRDFRFTDETGNVIMEITSQWVLIDIARRRPVALNKWVTGLDATELQPIVPPAGKIAFPADVRLERIFTAEPHDIDFNRHVNNAAYLVWAMDTIPRQWLEKKSLRGFEIAFLKESKCGEKISSWIALNDNHSYHILRYEDEDRATIALDFS